jgi:hypothetical protein
MPFKDECNLCGRVLSTRRLRRCQRCGQLYCRDCMIADVATGDPTRLFCLNCARKTVSPTSVSKYYGLTRYLKFRGAFTSRVKLSFVRIDGIIRDNLPMSAYKSERWWDNLQSSIHAKGWLEAGWETEEVNLKEGYVVFKKVKETKTARGRSSKLQIKKPFTPVHVKAWKPKTPSKTKVSKLYARIKNLERQRSSMPKYHGSFKPKSKHEKTLFKQDEKPH